MKLLIAGATLALLYAGAGIAQTQATGDKPEAAAPPAVTLATGNDSKRANDADARHCLVMKNNLEIIRCAEKYRYRGGTKAAAKEAVEGRLTSARPASHRSVFSRRVRGRIFGALS